MFFSSSQIAVAKDIWKHWLDVATKEGAALPEVVAACMVGNATQESSLDPHAIGDAKKAIGLWQQHWDPRGMEVFKETGIDIRKGDIKDQCDAVAYELGLYKPGKGWYRHLWPLLLPMTDIALMTTTFVDKFEGASKPMTSQRVGYANEWYARFSKHP